MTLSRYCVALLVGFSLLAATPVKADGHSSKLIVTGGLAALGGAAGGGLATWAVIAGYETEHQVGATAHVSTVRTDDLALAQTGFAVGFDDRFELSFAHQRGRLGARANNPVLGSGLISEQDVLGFKLRLFGQTIYDQDTWLPQVAVGLQIKKNENAPLVLAAGARDASDVDFYVACTKVLLSERLLLNATLRSTRANQLGLLGFGGPLDDSRALELEASVGYLLSRRTLVGLEYATKPNRLPGAIEEDWKDAFIAFFPRKSVSCILGFVDLGQVANLGGQQGFYSSVQIGF